MKHATGAWPVATHKDRQYLIQRCLVTGSHESFALNFASRCLCLSVRQVRRIFWEVGRVADRWTPCLRAAEQASPPASPLETDSAPEEDDWFLRALVREAIAAAAEGRSHVSYVKAAQRLAIAHSYFESKYLSVHFASEVAALASLVLQELDAFDFNQPLPAIGIPSDFAILGDPVSMGESILARHDVLFVMCLSLVSARNGRLYNPMHSGRAMPIGSHSGDAMVALVREALLEHPAAWGPFTLRARAASVGGDGGLCRGGPDHRHKSPGTAEKLWRVIHPDPAAPVCSSWDPFHRVDIAVWRAVRQHEAMLDVFDLAKEVDYLFGQSEGVVIFRSVATALDEDVHRIAAPGGTRKVVYLSTVPGGLVSNYKTIRSGLWARLEWKQAGHSTHSLAKLMDLGRRLSGVRVVVHLVCLQDVLSVIVRPFAKQVQRQVEPCTLLLAQTAVLGRIRHCRLLVRRVRVLLRVVALCRQHASPEDLVRLVEAHAVGRAAAALPTFFEHAPRLLGAKCIFRGCEINAHGTSAHDGSQQMLLGAHCQCDSRATHYASASAAGGNPRSPPSIPHPRRARCPVVVVPAWVAAGPDARPIEGDLVNVDPRCVRRSRGLQAPPGLLTTGMFRNRIQSHREREPCAGAPAAVNHWRCVPDRKRFRRGDWRCVPNKWSGLCPCRWTSTCQVSHSAFVADCEANAGLADIDAFLETLAVELGQILGSVGVNDAMAELLVLAASCWDWSRLLFERPSVPDLHAFSRLSAVLEPLLRHTLFPEDPAFDVVPRCWPGGRGGAYALAQQYMLLCRRVRLAQAAAINPDINAAVNQAAHNAVPEEVAQAAATWAPVAQYDVAPLWVCGGWFAAFGQLWRQRSVGDAFDRLRLSSRICRYAGGPVASPLPAAAFDGWRVAPNRLSRRARPKRGEAERPWVAGDVATLRPSGRRVGRGQLVEVVCAVRSVDAASVSATLDMLPWFTLGSVGGASAWGANRLRHRCRMLFPPDSCCESMGSLMRLLWSQRRSRICPAQLVDSVFLSQAAVACVGEPRDEMIVAEVTGLLRASSKYQVRSRPPGSPRRAGEPAVPAHVAKLGERLRASGRTCQDVSGAGVVSRPSGFEGVVSAKGRRAFLQQRAQNSRPNQLPPVMARAVQGSIGPGGGVKALPLDVRHLHAVQQGATVSVQREKVAVWHEEWRSERQRLMRADDPSSESEVELV